MVGLRHVSPRAHLSMRSFFYLPIELKYLIILLRIKTNETKMAKSASKFKKNMLPILLTAIVIVGFLFSALYLMNRVNPLFADAKKECDECPYDERDNNRFRNPFEYLFGPQGIFYSPSPKPPVQERSWWNPWSPKEGNSSSTQPRVNNPYPQIDPTTGGYRK